MKLYRRFAHGNLYSTGQSMVEMAVAFPFLIMLVLALIEMGIIFGSYISLVNATREGAIFASMHPELTNSANDGNAYGNGSTVWNEYVKRVNDEILVVIGEPLREGQIIDQHTLTINRPALGPTTTACPTRLEIGCPITVTVYYSVETFSSRMSLPGFGRFGLPNTYRVSYSFGVPIR